MPQLNVFIIIKLKICKIKNTHKKKKQKITHSKIKNLRNTVQCSKICDEFTKNIYEINILISLPEIQFFQVLADTIIKNGKPRFFGQNKKKTKYVLGTNYNTLN